MWAASFPRVRLRVAPLLGQTWIFPSLLVAVIAPLVNWVTGSDQIKNLFLVLFLIVYLHQLVQGVSQ
jgi:hypothetical protein